MADEIDSTKNIIEIALKCNDQVFQTLNLYFMHKDAKYSARNRMNGVEKAESITTVSVKLAKMVESVRISTDK